LNREGAKGAKGVFIALRAGYSTFVNSVHNYILNRKDAKDAKGSFFIALRAGYLLRLFTMRLMPSFINGTFQFKRKPSLRLVSLR
jgi:hypothetical protein